MICNNISQTHNLITIDDSEALRVICSQCKKQFVIRKDPFTGAPEKRQYAKVFKRDILQGNDNLLYKYRPDFLKV
jgi:hypothetical protein